MSSYQLPNMDARLTFLALQYHLARPGSELDPNTKRPAEHGLAEVAAALEPQLQAAVVTIELSEEQRLRLLSAISGTMNELKTYPLLEGGRRTSMPRFDAALRELFPDVEGELDELVAHLMTLRRRLERAAGAAASAGAEPASGRAGWWRFWERGRA